MRNLVVCRGVEHDGRRRTFDDDNAPNALQTVAKEQAKLKSEGLHVSRSVGNLARSRDSSTPLPSPDLQKGKTASKDEIKALPVRQRRGTLPWAGVSPQIRQSYLEDVAEDRLADTWFSLHCSTVDEPVYISEIVKHAMNPDFQFFDLITCGPLVSRLDEVTVKVWARSGAMTGYVLLLEHTTNLRLLQYLGKSLDTFHHSLPANCLIFHFPEGVYANLPSVPTWTAPTPVTHTRLDGNAQFTSSYDALMRLANLDDCIQDALITRQKLEAQMNAIIEKNRTSVDLVTEKSHVQERLVDVRRAVASTKRQIRASSKRKTEIAQSLEARRKAMAKGREVQRQIAETLKNSKPAVQDMRTQLKHIAEETTDQIRRICEDISHIYPIEAIPNRPLSFTICGLHLPDSIYEESNKDQVAAALGYAAHVLHLVSFYTSTPLPYPIKACLSRSTIDDPLSMKLIDRTFPLFSTNPYYRFEYAVFLFNKNIEYLMTRFGLRIIDIRQTLPNMKYLLYILTAGTRELPLRKAGGVIRGLLGSGRTDTPSDGSRRNSQDSAFSTGGFSIGNEALSRRMREQLIRENALAVSPVLDSGSQRPSGDEGRQAVLPTRPRSVGPRVVLSDEHSNDQFLT